MDLYHPLNPSPLAAMMNPANVYHSLYVSEQGGEQQTHAEVHSGPVQDSSDVALGVAGFVLVIPVVLVIIVAAIFHWRK